MHHSVTRTHAHAPPVDNSSLVQCKAAINIFNEKQTATDTCTQTENLLLGAVILSNVESNENTYANRLVQTKSTAA